MLSDLIPLMNETVQHWLAPSHAAIGGQPIYDGSTEHRARVSFMPSIAVTQGSHERFPKAAAIMWLINHPRPVCAGDTFTLADDVVMRATRVERHTIAGASLHKVHLN